MDSENYMPVCLVLSVIIFISSFLIGFSWRVVDYDQYGLVVNEISRAVVSETVYESGRHFVGLGNVFETFEKDCVTSVWLRDDKNNTNKNEENPGSAAGDISGPITIRTKDGQRLDLDITFQYALDKSTITQLYVAYGKEYSLFFDAIARARIRDRASTYSSDAFFDARIDIEKDFHSTMEKELSTRFVRLVDFQLHEIYIPEDLETRLKQIQLNEIEYTYITTQLQTDVILKETTQAITTLKATRDAKLLTLNQNVDNEMSVINKKLRQAQEETLTQVQYTRSLMDKELGLFAKVTETNVEKTEGVYQRVNAGTALQVANITAQVNELKAKMNFNVSVLSAEANRKYDEKNYDGRSGIIKHESNATKVGFAAFKADAGFSGEDIVAYQFSKMVGSQPSDKLRMDLQKPKELYLPGQQESQSKNLKDQHTGLI